MKTLTEQQLKIMRVLWDRGEATVSDVVTALKDDLNLARTTVATVLTRLEKQGYVSHRKREVSHVYFAVVERHAVQKNMVSRLVNNLFGGDMSGLVSQLLHDDDYDTQDVQKVIALIKDYEEGADRDA